MIKLKVLVADANLKSNKDCCQYLANDEKLDITSVSSGFNTLGAYYKIKPNILVINSDFKDKNYMEIINELSTTSEERKNCNVILTVKNSNEKIELEYMAKIYKLFYFPLNYQKIKNGIDQYNLDNEIFYEPNEANLRALFYKIHVYNEHIGATYLKYAIMRCYEDPSLLNSLNFLYELIAKEFNVSYNSIRPAMRNALNTLRSYKDNGRNKLFLKLFDADDPITPKNFIRIITTYYLKQK